MAEQQATPQALQWGRTPDGRFFINASLPVQMKDGLGYLPIHSFILSKEEEAKLKASLSNIVLATGLPAHNGHKN